MLTQRPSQSRQKSREKTTLEALGLFFSLACTAGLIIFVIFDHSLAPSITVTNRPSTSTTPEFTPTQKEAMGAVPSLPTNTAHVTSTKKGVASSTAPSPAVPPSSQRINNSGFGISVADTFSGLSSAELNARMNDIASLGVRWIRLDMDWSVVQHHNSTTYDWSGIDRVVAAASVHHLNVLPILVYTPRWARAPDCSSNRCPPADPSQFGNFANAAVKRFASQGIHTWEIWNEPNMAGSWIPEADPSSYVTLLRAAYTAIKKEDPTAVVITGGLGPIDSSNGNVAPLDFLEQIYQNDAQAYFDAVGFHPYSFPVTASYVAPWNAWQQMANTYPSLRSIMISHGDASKQIWITEYGAPTGGPGPATDIGTYNADQHTGHITEALQAQMATDAEAQVQRDTWAGPLFWYSYKDLGTSNSTIENFFGLLRYDGSQKPAYEALRNAISSATVQ